MSSFPWSRYVTASAIFMLLSACILPIQTARIPQFETYTQTFQLEPDDAERVFRKLLGQDSWEMLEERWKALETNREMSITDFIDTIEIRGAISITTSILPSSVDTFAFEGTGRFYVIQKMPENSVILFTGDFFVIDDLHSIDELNDGEIVVGTRQHYIRHLQGEEIEEWNYYDETRVDFRMYIDNSMAKHAIYSLNYETDRHQVELDGEVIGHFKFNEPRPGFRKVLDLRGRRLLRNDYRKKYRAAQ